jgi:hypothetical protein
VTANVVPSQFEFAVVVSNTSSETAHVRIDDGGLAAPREFDVLPNEVHVERLPWVDPLKADCAVAPCFTGAILKRGAYHLPRRPVIVYQFNPLDYQQPSPVMGQPVDHSYTNDASLLLPTNALTGNYITAAYPHFSSYPSMLTIVGTKDGTTVGVTTHALGLAGPVTFIPGVTGQVTLDAGEAMQILSTAGDLTGTIVGADRPVQVIGGHYCTNIPLNIAACDHLESRWHHRDAVGSIHRDAAGGRYVQP